MLLKRLMASSFQESRDHKYRRHGQRFQNQYKPILCQEDLYVMELVRYLHVNPLRAGLGEGMEDLEKYPWFGHSAILGKKHQAWHRIDYAARGATVLDMDSGEVLARGKTPQTVNARRLLCYWANRELGMKTVEHIPSIEDLAISREQGMLSR